MNNILQSCFCICAMAVLTGKSVAGFSSDDANGDAVDVVGKRGWTMLGVAPGLKILRLGKRSASLDNMRLRRQLPMLRMGRSADDSNSDSNKLSPSDLQALLASILDEPRDQSRRQPPLPRYGRDSSSSSNNNNRRDLLDAISADDASAFPLDLFPVTNTRFFFRPAPRGGRYKRSLPVGGIAYGDFVLQDTTDNSQRAVPMPRIGRYLEQLAHLQPKAVPRPRIGRQKVVQTDDSSKTQSV